MSPCLGSILVLSAMAGFCQGLVDTYTYHYDEPKAVSNDLASTAYSLSADQQNLFATYTGEKAETCKADAKKDYDLLEFNTMWLREEMISVVQKAESIDTEMYQRAQKCQEGDKQCVDKAKEPGLKELEEYKKKTEPALKKLKQANLDKLKQYMDNCTKENKSSC